MGASTVGVTVKLNAKAATRYALTIPAGSIYSVATPFFDRAQGKLLSIAFKETSNSQLQDVRSRKKEEVKMQIKSLITPNVAY
jgi:hypothetical protein